MAGSVVATGPFHPATFLVAALLASLYVGIPTLFGAILAIAVLAPFLSAVERVFLSAVSRNYRRVCRFRDAELVHKRAMLAWRRWEERQRTDWWLSLDGHRFEAELAQLFRGDGYNVVLTPQTGDGGVDIVLKRGREKTVVQCKAHRVKIGVAAVRELAAARSDFGADRAILASLSGVTRPALDYARPRDLRYSTSRTLSPCNARPR